MPGAPSNAGERYDYLHSLRREAFVSVLARLVAFMPLILSPLLATAQTVPRLHPKVIALERSDNGILPILTDPPETVTMRSGYVVLDPGRSVGKHSTEHHEEILIVLEGKGEMLFHDGSKLALKARTAVYCPPGTEHDVKNSGPTPLRYVYVVANVQ
jgi:quercetin dioxygenase-like cupin family protein